MTPLRQRMIDALELRGVSPKTVKLYVDCISRFARHFKARPEKLGSDQSDVRLTVVSCATGANVSSEEPLNVSANLKSKALIVAGAGVAPDVVAGGV